MNGNNGSLEDFLGSTQLIPYSTSLDTSMLTTQEPLASDVQQLVKPWYPFIIACMYIIIAATIPGNIIVIASFLKYPLLRSPTNYLICNQSIVDMMACVMAIIFICFNYMEAGVKFVIMHKYGCLFNLWSILSALMLSAMNIFALSTERLIAVVWSLQYYNWVTEKSVCWVLAVGWLVVLLIGMLPLMGWNTWRPGITCFVMNVCHPTYFIYIYILPVVAMLILTALFNIIISFIAGRKSKVIPEVEVAVVNQNGQQADSQGLPTANHLQPPRSVNFKITKMMLMVVGAYYLSWLPYLVMSLPYFMAPVEWKRSGLNEWILFLHDFSKCFLLLNGVCNPFIYAHRSVRFRIAFRRLFGFPVSQELKDAAF